MSSRRLRFGAAASCLLAIAGCKFDDSVPDGAQITCGSNADCPEGYLCNNGGCVNVVVPPPLIEGAVVVAPEVGRAGTEFTISFTVSKELAALPEVTLQPDSNDPEQGLVAPVCSPSDMPGETHSYSCTYTATGQESGGEAAQGDLPSFPRHFDVRLRDAAHNQTTLTGAGKLTLDFVGPGMARATVAYFPDASNPLPVVRRAKELTRLEVTVIPSEAIRTDPVPTLLAALGGTEIHFSLLQIPDPGNPGSLVPDLTPTRASFEGWVPLGAVEGDYVPTLVWSDVAGNQRTLIFSTPSISVKTSRPVLAIDDALVTFLRSPWGNAAEEELRACPTCPAAFVIPAGPYFALAPGDTLAPTSTLAPRAFSVDANSVPAALRVWADGAKGSLVAVVPPDRNPDGTIAYWPRARLHMDVPAVWATMLDDAGNESDPPIQIAHSEWVATANLPAFGVTPHAVDASVYLTETLVPDLDTSFGPQAGLAGLDASVVAVAAQSTFRQIVFGPAPPARSSHAMAYDSARGAAVVFGGDDAGGQRLGDTWEWDGGAWTDRTPIATGSPSPRRGHAMAYDSARNRVVLYGGTEAGGGMPADTWEWDGSTWLQVASTGPGGRDRHGMSYDSARRKVVLFGGAAADRTTWEWDGASWAPAPAANPPTARANFGMAFDAARGCVVLYGGSAGGNRLSDVWEYCGGASWTGPVIQGGTLPGAREGHTLAWDVGTRRTVSFGGASQDGSTFAWNGRSWAAGATAPVGSSRHAAAYDAKVEKMVVFGGQQDSGGGIARLNTTLEWDDWRGSWTNRTRPAPPNDRPAPRAGSAMAFDEAEGRGRAVLFGGTSGSSFPADVWEWDGVRWWNPSASGPAGRARQAMAYQAYSATTGRVVLFGGRATGAPLNDLWEWNGSAWTQRFPAGALPQVRTRAGLAFDSLQGLLVLFGGDGAVPNPPLPLDPVPLDDTWELSGSPTLGWTWTRRANPPPAGLTARYGHSLLSTGSGPLAFFGVLAGLQLANDAWQWNAASRTWTRFWQGSAPDPEARGRQAMAWDQRGGRALLFGGTGAQGELGDVWEWTGAGFVARSRPPRAPWPQARTDCAVAFDPVRGRAVLFGGSSAGATLDDLWEWDADRTRDGLGQRRAPMAQLTVSYAGAGFSQSGATGIRVRARAGGDFGTGTGAQLLGWRSGGVNVGPGAWVPLASTGDGLPLAPAPAGSLDWSAPQSDVASFLLTREGRLAFQLRPAGVARLADPDARLEADYLEVRVRY